MLTVITFALYGITIFSVSQYDYQRNVTAYEQNLGRYEQRTAERTAETLSFVALAQRGPNGRSRPSSRERHEINEISEDRRRLGEPATLLKVVRSQHFAKNGLVGEYVLILEHDARAELADPEPQPPNPLAVPRWFGHLGSFFTVATQLLGAIVLVLVFTRWRAGASEAVFRTVMPVEVTGLVAGLIANLPLLSRQLQAFLLAPVLAGLAAALGALAVIAMSPPGKYGTQAHKAAEDG